MMKFVLLGNYPLDRQESMKRYSLNLRDSLIRNEMEAVIWMPKVFFAYGWKSTTSGPGKWLGYLDKWMLFPIILRLRLFLNSQYPNTFFHVCDHSNSPYLKVLPTDRSGITCHDVLAIRGALGYEDAYCPASATGKILQRWILNNLKKAKYLTAVSQFTMNQLLGLCADNLPMNINWKVIHNSLNADFRPMDAAERSQLIVAAGIPKDSAFILSVGSSLPRKNRKMLLDMVKKLGDRWQGYICFAGQPLNDNLQYYIESQGLKDRVISVIKPDHQTLVALYSACTVFVFPSFSEGFGWPLIEAQACGAPVLASNIEPMPEVSNYSAVHADPADPEDFAMGFMEILNKEYRNRLINLGYENCKRFDSQVLNREFIKLYTNPVQKK